MDHQDPLDLLANLEKEDLEDNLDFQVSVDLQDLLVLWANVDQ